MALIISEAEIRQHKDLQDKEVLLKEVHHRVKNNLQLIVSIMNMEMRNAETPEARRMLRGLQRRVRGLATLHRTLYASPDMTTVDGGELVRAVVEDVAQVSLPSEVSLSIETIPADLYPDQAVPLSMLSAEALTNAVKYVGRPEDGSAPRISVTLERLDGDRLRLRIVNSKGAPLAPPETEETKTSGLGSRLMKAFVMQIEGEAEVTETADSYCYDVVFSRREFANDAARRRAAA
jgi:two-component sensor histidine kinase